MMRLSDLYELYELDKGSMRSVNVFTSQPILKYFLLLFTLLLFFTIPCGLDIFVTDQYFYVIIVDEWRHILVQNTPKFWYRSTGASDDNTCFSGILKFPYKCMGDVTFSDRYNSVLDYNILDLITGEYSPYHGPYYIQKLHLDIYALDLYYNYKIS